MDESGLSVVIPTYGREAVLIETIAFLLSQVGATDEVIVVDQTSRHDDATDRELARWNECGQIDWLRLQVPSIPHAMNVGLQAARNEIVLFLDDDIVPAADLLHAHRMVHRHERQAEAVVGQVLQPGEVSGERMPPKMRHGLRGDLEFPFCSNSPGFVENVMAGNLSVNRQFALAIGGFDENFTGVAYRFETEFAKRVVKSGGKIWFCPAASIRHLRAPSGGTRHAGSHLTSASPRYGIGDYYYAMLCGETHWEKYAYILRRPLREVSTKFHLRHPWYIPIKLIGELRAYWGAKQLFRRGPRLVSGTALAAGDAPLDVGCRRGG